MDKDYLITLFATGKAPAEKNNKDVLRHIVQTFPYFQMAQVLYARQMYIENDPEVSSRIKLASAYAPDRKAMYALFRENPYPPEVVTLPQADSTDTDDKNEEIKYNYIYSSNEPQASSTPEKNCTPSLPPPAEAVQHLKDNAPEQNFAENSIPPSETFLEMEIAAAAAGLVTEKQITETPSTDTFGKNTNLETGPVIEPHPAIESELFSFSDWLKNLPMTETKTKSVRQPVKTLELPQTTSGIIERFLANEPTISRPKSEFFSPSKVAKQSITYDDGLVSETLAEIYVKQGNLPMALKAYRTLHLQNPEKMTYFASRIKEISRLMESGNSKNK